MDLSPGSLVRHVLSLLAALCLLTSSADAQTRSAQQAIVYGEDGRVEASDAGPQWEQLVDETVVAVIPSERLVLLEPGVFTVDAVSLGEDRTLCDGERFADQPAAANCTGALIDDRLVMTAGHCVRDTAECRKPQLCVRLPL